MLLLSMARMVCGKVSTPPPPPAVVCCGTFDCLDVTLIVLNNSCPKQIKFNLIYWIDQSVLNWSPLRSNEGRLSLLLQEET